MPRTTQCDNCGVILNLPDKAKAGKRLRCPKCGTRFVMTSADASSESTFAAPLDADPNVSAHEMAHRRPDLDDLPLPMADRDLRETFDLPLMSARDAEREGATPAAAVSDAASLFQDEPPTRRRGTAGDARSRARRCSNCGGLVPQGMSICVSCGTDQETGMRVGLEDDLAPPPPPPPSGPPLHIAIVGSLLGFSALGLLVFSLINSIGGSEGGWEKYGWICLAIVSGFSIYAIVQFIRLKSAKLLMLALTLGVIIDLLALVAMPLVLANMDSPVQMDPSAISTPAEDPDAPVTRLASFEEKFDMKRFSTGVSILVVYAVLSVYLMSPAVKKPILRANASW